MTVVYFLRKADGTGPIKIGTTRNAASRLKVFQTASPEPVIYILTAKGTYVEERIIHRMFDHLRLHGEWFEANEELLKFIADIPANGLPHQNRVNDRDAIAGDMYVSGSTLEEIGERFNITRERVRQILRKNGIKSLGYRQTHKNRCPASRSLDVIENMHRDGKTAEEIAKIIGDATQNVQSYARKMGIRLVRKRQGPSPESVKRAKLILADYTKGVKTSEIASRYGLKQPDIYRYLRMAGLPKPNRREPCTSPSHSSDTGA